MKDVAAQCIQTRGTVQTNLRGGNAFFFFKEIEYAINRSYLQITLPVEHEPVESLSCGNLNSL